MTVKFKRPGAGDWNTDAEWSLSSNTTPGTDDTTFPTAADIATFDAFSGNCTLDANAAALGIVIGTVGSLYAGTLDAATFDVALGTSGLDCTYGGSATVDLGTGTWTCDGDWDHADLLSLTRGTSLLSLTGTGKSLITGGVSKRLESLLIASGATITNVDATQTDEELTVDGEFELVSSIQLGFNSPVTINTNGRLFGDAQLQFGLFTIGGSPIVINGGGVFDVSVRYFNWTANIAAIAYPKNLELRASNAITLTPLGNITVVGDLTLQIDAANDLTIDGTANNPDWDIQGDVIYIQSSTGAITWTPGTGSMTLSGVNQSIDFNDQPIEDIEIDVTGTTTLAGGFQTDSFTGTAGTFDPNGQNIQAIGNMDWAAAFDFAADAATMDGSAWTVGGNFTADGQTLNATSAWTLAVTGTAVASGIGSVEYSNASGGTEIDASAGPWVDGLNNTNWKFVSYVPYPHIAGMTGGIAV